MRDVVMGLQPITILKSEEKLNEEKSSIENVSEESSKIIKRCNDPESKILAPLLNRNKERVTKGNSNVTFSDDCVFNQKTKKKIRT